MKKLTVLVLIGLLLAVSGCKPEPADPFAAVDKATRSDVVDFLISAARGGWGEYTLGPYGDVGFPTVGEVSGSVSGSPAGAEVVSYSFLDATLIEVEKTPVKDGRWGPLTVLYGPKVLVLMEGDAVLAYWLTPQRFAMAPLTKVSQHKDFRVSPRESGLVALALAHSGKYQEAANLLAAMRPAHMEYQGLPLRADIFGRALTEGIDPGATAWAGYAAAVLAATTGNDNLWEEARSYALYLRDIEAPEAVDSRLAGWLLFSTLVDKYPEFGYLPAQWQPQQEEGYDPLYGTWLLLSGQDIAAYVDTAYQPESPAEKWIHYNLLAAMDALPEELALELMEFPCGKAVGVEGQPSLEASCWMVLAFSGKFRDSGT
ncbi:MAG: hypothetical protein ACOX2G_00905 [Bacillota bacterium]|jgi:hypothetical protein